jgi:hypothetical protein
MMQGFNRDSCEFGELVDLVEPAQNRPPLDMLRSDLRSESSPILLPHKNPGSSFPCKSRRGFIDARDSHFPVGPNGEFQWKDGSGVGS